MKESEEMIELKKLSPDDGRDIYDMLQAMPKDENGLINNVNGMTFDEYKQWLLKKQQEAEQTGLVDGWKVPSTTYWLYVDGCPVGFGNVRNFLTDALKKAGGNIGYGIVSEYRGKGYGKELLRLLLKKAREAGVEKALLTIRADNQPSLAVALANGGVITEKTDERIWVWIETFDKKEDAALRSIVIKPLTSELNNDYLDFFDNRAFTDDNPNGPCYCTSPNQDEETGKRMVSEFKTFGVKETLRKYAVEMLEANAIHGYLAYDGELAIGWCNAADMDSYAGFVPDFARKNKCGKTVSIVCFEIAPEYRGMGIASAFIEKVCSDARENGYAAVEGYAVLSDKRNAFDFQGPMKLYQKAGFKEVMRENGQVVMRKLLG